MGLLTEKIPYGLELNMYKVETRIVLKMCYKTIFNCILFSNEDCISNFVNDLFLYSAQCLLSKTIVPKILYIRLAT